MFEKIKNIKIGEESINPIRHRFLTFLIDLYAPLNRNKESPISPK